MLNDESELILRGRRYMPVGLVISEKSGWAGDASGERLILAWPLSARVISVGTGDQTRDPLSLNQAPAALILFPGEFHRCNDLAPGLP